MVILIENMVIIKWFESNYPSFLISKIFVISDLDYYFIPTKRASWLPIEKGSLALPLSICGRKIHATRYFQTRSIDFPTTFILQ
jgi:hypothetical protein